MTFDKKILNDIFVKKLKMKLLKFIFGNLCLDLPGIFVIKKIIICLFDLELEQGCLFYMGSNKPSPTAQTLLCAPSKSQSVCPGLGIYEPSESKASGLGSLIKNYSSPWPGLASHIYTLSGAESWPWMNSPLASNRFAPGPGSYINSSSGANTIISINWPPQFSIPKRKQLNLYYNAINY